MVNGWEGHCKECVDIAGKVWSMDGRDIAGNVWT